MRWHSRLAHGQHWRRRMVVVILLLLAAWRCFPSCLMSHVSCLDPLAWAASEEEELYLIKRAFEDRFHEVVVEQGERFLGAYPRSPYHHEVLLLIGQSCHALGRYYKALGVLETLRADPRTSPAIGLAALFWTGEVHLKGGDYPAARRYYEEVLKVPEPNEHRPYAEYSIAWSFYEEGKVEEALQRFQAFGRRYAEQALAVDAQLKVAQCLYRLKRYHDAAEQLSLFLQAHPDSPQFAEALYLLGEAWYYQRAYDRAIEQYQRALTLAPTSPWAPYALYGVVWSLFHGERYEEALAACQQFQERFPGDPLLDGVLFVTASSLVKRERFADAAELFERLTVTYPNSDWCDDAFLWRGEALFRLGRFAEAATVYQAGVDRFAGGGSEVLDELAYNLGWALVQDGRPEEARAAFEQIVQRNADEALVVSAFCRLGDLAYDRREYPQAIEWYDRVLREHADSYFADLAQYQLGLCLVQLGREDDARLAFRSLLAHFSASTWAGPARLQLGMSFFRQGDYTRAISEWERLLEARPMDDDLAAQALFQIGNAHYNAGDYARAQSAYQRLLKESPQHAVASLAQYQLAWTFAQRGDTAEAARRFQRYVAQQPMPEFAPDAIFWLGEQALLERRFDDARRQFGRIVEEFGRSELADDAIYWIGQAFAEQGQATEAVERFRRLIEAYPGSPLVPEAALAIGVIDDAEGREAEARQQWEWVIARYPQMRFQALAYERIAEQFKRRGDYDGAAAYLATAIAAATPEARAHLQYRLAECHQERGALEEALQEYLKVDYLYPGSGDWSRRARLKAAQICEARQRWAQARSIYERLAAEPVEEARYAQERLQWLDQYLGGEQAGGGS